MSKKSKSSTGVDMKLIEEVAAVWIRAETDQEMQRWAQREATARLHAVAGGYRALADHLNLSKSLVARYGRTGCAFPPSKRIAHRSCRDHERALTQAGKILGTQDIGEAAEEALEWLKDETLPTQKDMLQAMRATVSPGDDSDGDENEPQQSGAAQPDSPTFEPIADVIRSLDALPPVLDPELPLLVQALVRSQVARRLDDHTQALAARVLTQALQDALAPLATSMVTQTDAEPEEAAVGVPAVAPESTADLAA